jgi:hypothetical protein
MIAIDEELDPLIQVGTTTYKPITLDGDAIACDDAGLLVCYGENASLEGAVINAGQSPTPDVIDAKLTVPWDIVERVKTERGNLIVLMTSFNEDSVGEYLAALHMGIGEAAS